MSVGPCSEKVNMVSNDHGRIQKCDFCVLIGKINFADRGTPDTINAFRDSVLACKMHDCYCTIRKILIYFKLLIYVMVQKMKEKKSELQCYISAPENLSVSKTYLISIYSFIIFFKAVTWASRH